MDYDTLFSEKEAQALFNRCQIRYDPGHFSFKPRLFFTSYRRQNQPVNTDFNTERCFIQLLEETFKGSANDVGFEHAIKHTSVLDLLNNGISEYCEFVCTLTHKNNYYINVAKLAMDLYKSTGVRRSCPDMLGLKDTKIYEALVTFMIASTHYNSIVPDLKWLCSSSLHSDYEYVVEMKAFEECLKSEEFKKEANIFLYDSINSIPCVPVSSSAPALVTVNSVFTGATKEDMQQVFWDTLVFAIEVFRNIESIEDDEIKQTLYDLLKTLNTEAPITYLLYSKDDYGNITLTDDVLNIINITDKVKRYYAIRDFVCNNIDVVNTSAELYMTHQVGISPILAELIKFCETESIMNIRIKTIVMLYEYLKSKNLLKDLHTVGVDEDSMPIPELGMGDNSIELPNTSMMNLSYAEYNDEAFTKKDVETSTDSPKTDTGSTFFEELDKLNADFESGMYTFKTKDVVSTDSSSKTYYNEIVDKMSLLNANLIRSIKEIKVYNTGGKNPGKKSGKLDRKNLYKYKTSKDIFFDNTYKVKESDLAFGIILDVSGSMYGEGIRNGKATMIVLHETLKALNINHSIITHTSKRFHNSIIDRYQAFKEEKTFNCNKNYALAEITSHGGNCDSGALYYMEQSLRRVKNKDKIVIIFSDGEPTECTETELKEQVRNMERKGIKVIGVGIDFPSIKEYYRNNANGRNLKEMFEIVSNILKEYVLEKIDKE